MLARLEECLGEGYRRERDDTKAAEDLLGRGAEDPRFFESGALCELCCGGQRQRPFIVGTVRVGGGEAASEVVCGDVGLEVLKGGVSGDTLEQRSHPGRPAWAVRVDCVRRQLVGPPMLSTKDERLREVCF